MAATIRDVAKSAGVNPSTVSRVINGKSVISAETRKRVYEAMAQLDYHPNSQARSLASGQSGSIGLVMDAGDGAAFNNAFFAVSQYAIEQVAQAHGYHLLIANGGAHSAQDVAALMLEKKADGLVLTAAAASEEVLRRIGSFPHVILGRPEEAGLSESWVDIDNRAGAEMAAKHLLGRGYRRIAYLGGDLTGSMGFIRRRLLGYLSALPCPPVLLPTDSAPDSAYCAARSALREKERPDAFLCDDNLAAFGLLRAVREAGLCVPKDIGVVTFNNAPLAEYLDPPLTAVDIDTAEQGRQTACLLFEQLAGHSEPRQVLLSPRLIERASSARAKTD